MTYPVFTICGGQVFNGARIDTLTLKGTGTEIPAILVGDEGRGRRLGVVTVQNAKSGDILSFAEVGKTKAGKPKLLAKLSANTNAAILVVLRTPIGFRGSNSHTGDRAGWTCDCGEKGEGNTPDKCPNTECQSCNGPSTQYAEFPCEEILATGKIAQGDAGLMGSGDQYIALIPKGKVFRTGYAGRMYGSPDAHYYFWDGEQLLSATWDERAATDFF